VVAVVRPRTAAAAAGLAVGDRIMGINAQPLRDAIDFQFYGGDDCLELSVEREGRRRALRLVRRPGADLGVELEAPRPAEIATCANKCVFCFIHQLPRGMRRSLYVKDDDFRLSFLHGNYITLSDLDEATKQFDQNLAEIVSQNAKIKSYVTKLESRASEEEEQATPGASDLPPASQLVDEIEQFMRQQRPE